MSQDAYSEYRDRQLENARVGYQVAVNLTNHEEQQMWARSGTMLVANAVITTAIGLYLTNSDIAYLVRVVLLAPTAGVGLFLCFLWLCLAERTSKKAEYWVDCAGGLESDYLDDPVDTLTRGKALSDKGEVTRHKPTVVKTPWWKIRERYCRKRKCSKSETIKMSCLGKLFRIKGIPIFMSFAFFSLYICLLIVGLCFPPDVKQEQRIQNIEMQIRKGSQQVGRIVGDLEDIRGKQREETIQVNKRLDDIDGRIAYIEGILEGSQQRPENAH